MLPFELGSAGWSESRYPFPNWTSGTTWRLVGAFGNSTWRGSITFDTPPVSLGGSKPNQNEELFGSSASKL